MFKKMMLVFALFFVSLSAQDEGYQFDNQYQFLVYGIGMNLAEQSTIFDQETAKNALIQVAQQNLIVQQIMAIFLANDQEMIKYNINSIDELFDFEFEYHYDLAMAGIVWLAAFQDVFVIFTQLHQDDCSFQTWCDDMAYLETFIDETQFEQDPDYLALWQACIAMLQAQEDFNYELQLVGNM